jgi:hypothetical protein
MPESKSKRKRKGRSRRPPSVQTPPKRRRTPRWVPYAFTVFMAAGVLVIVGDYVFWNGSGILLFAGLASMGLGFAVSTRWY